MAIKTINDEHLVNIAAAIRGKNGTETTYKPSEMAAAIAAIETGGGSGGNYPTVLYYNAAGGTTYGPSNYYPFDVSNATTMTFKYTCKQGSYPNPVYLSAYLGYGITVTNSGYYTYSKVDSSTKTQVILSNNRDNMTDVEVTLDVTNYTSVTLYTYFSSNTNYSAYGCISIHDIEIK